MGSYIGSDVHSIQRSIVNHVEYTLARTRFNFDNNGAYHAASNSVRDRLIEAWNDTNDYHNVSHMMTFIHIRPKDQRGYIICLLSS
jgi:starch phosphorylase